MQTLLQKVIEAFRRYQLSEEVATEQTAFLILLLFRRCKGTLIKLFFEVLERSEARDCNKNLFFPRPIAKTGLFGKILAPPTKQFCITKKI